MKIDKKKIFAIFFILILVVALTRAALGIMSWTNFFIIAGLMYVYVRFIQPRIKD